MAKPYSMITSPRATAWTNEQLIERIHAWYDIEGVPPRASDWNPSLARRRGFHDRAERFEREGCWPYVSAFQHREFPRHGRGFAAAIRAAGLTPRPPGLDSALRERDGSTRAERTASLTPAAQRNARNAEIRRLAATGRHTVDSLAKRYGLRSVTIRKIVGPGVFRRRRRVEARNEQIGRMAAAGTDYVEIAARYKLSTGSVAVIVSELRRAGYDIPNRKHRPEHTARLRAEMVRLRNDEAKTNREIAGELELATNTVASYISRLRRDGVPIDPDPGGNIRHWHSARTARLNETPGA